MEAVLMGAALIGMAAGYLLMGLVVGIAMGVDHMVSDEPECVPTSEVECVEVLRESPRGEITGDAIPRGEVLQPLPKHNARK